METDIKFLNISNEQEGLNKRAYERYLKVKEFFLQNLKSNYILVPEEPEKNKDGTVIYPFQSKGM